MCVIQTIARLGKSALFHLCIMFLADLPCRGAGLLVSAILSYFVILLPFSARFWSLYNLQHLKSAFEFCRSITGLSFKLGLLLFMYSEAYPCYGCREGRYTVSGYSGLEMETALSVLWDMSRQEISWYLMVLNFLICDIKHSLQC